MPLNARGRPTSPENSSGIPLATVQTESFPAKGWETEGDETAAWKESELSRLVLVGSECFHITAGSGHHEQKNRRNPGFRSAPNRQCWRRLRTGAAVSV